MEATVSDVLILGHYTYSDKGLIITFQIRGVKFKRVSLIGTRQLLWWQNIDTENYMDETESDQLEGIVKNFLIGYKLNKESARMLT